MAVSFNNNQIHRKVPIKRNNKFFGGEDFNLELDFATEYMEQDMNQTVILYQVDLEKTKVNDVYVEAKKDAIRFKTPIELPCVYEIQDAEVKSYDSKVIKGVYANPGKLVFSVLIKTLEENDCDIKRGDYIGVQVTTDKRLYFVVNDDGRVQSYSNKNTLYGVTSMYRQIIANFVDQGEFNG